MKTTNSCICTNVRRAAQSLTEFYDGVLAPSGLKVTQFVLLYEIVLHEYISITQLAHEVDLDRTTTGKNLQVLARNGLITFAVGEDRRERMVKITVAGRHAFERARPLWEEAQTRVKTTLGNEHVADLLSLLSNVEIMES